MISMVDIARKMKAMDAKYKRLRSAVSDLYYAAHWSPDRDVDADGLWTAVRDAAHLKRGKFPKRIA